MIKTGTWHDTNNDNIHSAGDQVTYAFTVTNTGNVTLTNVSVTDVNPAVIISGSPISSLAPGSTDNSTITGTYTLTQADIDAGTFTNTATVTGTPPSGDAVTDSDDDIQSFIQSPSLSVEKDVDQTSINTPGILTYTITVDNTGNTSLTGITITDAFATSGPTLISGDTNNDGALQVDETWTYTATYTVTQADIDAGRELVNLVIVDSDQTEPVQDDAVTTISQNALLSVDKTQTSTDPVTASGQVITYQIVITNTGNISLNGVSATESYPGPGAGTLSDLPKAFYRLMEFWM